MIKKPGYYIINKNGDILKGFESYSSALVEFAKVNSNYVRLIKVQYSEAVTKERSLDKKGNAIYAD